MEHEDKSPVNPYAFLMDERIERRFADINIDLLRGRHIQPDDYYTHQLLSDPEIFAHFHTYYQSLYGLILKRSKNDSVVYFYLDFPEEGRGRMNTGYRFKELSPEQTIIGIMLLNMYYTRWFERSKEIHWEDIRQEIEQGESAESYRQLLFGELRADYTDPEWKEAEGRFVRTIGSFNHLGWVEKLSDGKDEIHFRIKESIHRLAELYADELEHLDELVAQISSIKEL